MELQQVKLPSYCYYQSVRTTGYYRERRRSLERAEV